VLISFFSGQWAIYTPKTTIYSQIGKSYETSTVIANIGSSWSQFTFAGTILSCAIATMSPPAWSISPPTPHKPDVVAQLLKPYKNIQSGNKISILVTNGTKSTVSFSGQDIEHNDSQIVQIVNNRKTVRGELRHKQAYIIVQHLLKGPHVLVDSNYNVIGELL